MRRNDGDRPFEIGIAICSAKLLTRRGPLGGDAPAAQDVTRLYLEDISEAAANGDLQLELNRFHAVIHNVEVFVHTAINRAADGEPERARRYGDFHGGDGSVGEEDACGVITDASSV